MNPDALADALRQTASRVPVGPPPVEAVFRQGRALRRRRRAAGLAVAAAVLAPACLLAVRSAGTPPSVPAGTAQAGTTQTGPQVVTSGEKVTNPSGTSLWLTEQGLFLTTAGQPGSAAESVLVADTPVGRLTGLARGSGSATVWAGVYRGPGTPAKLTLAVDGRTLPARLYALAGSPGWVAYSAETALPRNSAEKPTVEAYAADGTLLLTTRL
ncbi:hypothetical protein ACF9IK_31945 [Kitasatospora hibisci]|uniref:hypothetical protein n=1 Tax=Kitasatospora hibisci TaxID=3369522 RepID=UPI003754931A